MRDDAVAPVVAVMLILAIVVTFFAAWNAYYVPSMKAQSEIHHLKDVESGFMRFSSDIETAASQDPKSTITLSELIPLGGGDFMFDPVKSGGDLKVWSISPNEYIRINWTNRTGPDLASPKLRSDDLTEGLVRFSYTPVNNFWQDQGYVWSYGNIYVNNMERNLITPLNADTMENVTYDDLAGTLVGLEPAAYTDSGECSIIILRVVDIVPEQQHTGISGNGNGLLKLVSRLQTPQRIINVTGLNLAVTAPMERFRAPLWESVNTSVTNMLARCTNAGRNGYDPRQQEIQLTFTPESNMTLIRETIQITIGAH